jgi:hypothetical protein
VTLCELALVLGIRPEDARRELVRLGLDDATAYALGTGTLSRDDAVKLAQLLSPPHGRGWAEPDAA